MKKNGLKKFLVLADLHGRIPQILVDEEFDAILCPGDICLDSSRELYERYFAYLREEKKQQRKQEGKGEEKKKDKRVKSLTFEQFLKHHITPQEITNLKLESVQRGREILELLNELHKPVYLVPGNWDPTKYCDGMLQKEEDVWKRLLEGLDNIYDCEFKEIIQDDILYIGYGSTSTLEVLDEESVKMRIVDIINQKLSKQEEESEIEEIQQRYLYQRRAYERIYELFENKKKDMFTIYISHNAPYNTPLDKIDNPRSLANGEHYGSVLSRDIIEKFEPELVICGHIHEGVGVCVINRSICLNAGFGNKINHIVTVDIQKKEVLEVKRIGENSK